MIIRDELLARLLHLKLVYLAEHLDEFIGRETKKRSSAQEIIEHLVELELDESTRRQVASRLRFAKLGKYKVHADYDWNWPTEVPREAIEQLFSLAFVKEPANVVFVGTAGLGKTMLAKNLAYTAVLQGHSALFVEAAEMLADLGSQETPRTFKARLNHYLRPKLLVLDEVGYLSYSSKSADILFQVVSQRYEKTSTIVTTNKAFKDWGTIFPGAGCVSVLIDRLTHHAEIIQVAGKSYRLHESENRKKESPYKPKPKGK
jgi:DNA replication protein DnaC